MKNLNKAKKVILMGLMFACFGFAPVVFGMERSIYILRGDSAGNVQDTKAAINSLEQHAKQIDLVLAQAYQVDEKGVVWGNVNSTVLKFTTSQHIKLMPMITNVDFDKPKVHAFLNDPIAQSRAILFILKACKAYHYYGVQFDFEMIPLNDRDVLTSFLNKASDALHKAGFAVSYAVAPLQTDDPTASTFLKKLYEVWEGAYDFKALGKSADFITIMAYNQHGEGTTPGPTAALDWVESVINYALKYVPPEKISLGIAGYSNYYYTGKSSSGKITSQMAGLGYNDAAYLINKYQVPLQWDDKNKVTFAIFERNWLYEYFFLEDARSFAPKLDLINKYHLRGFGLFRIGIEDPKIWSEL